MNYKFNGVLVYNDNAEYEIHSSDGKHNLSNIFNKVYETLNQKISIIVNKINFDKSIFNIIDLSGVIYEVIDKDGLFSWHINGKCIDKVLFDNVGEEVEVVIDIEIIL